MTTEGVARADEGIKIKKDDATAAEKISSS